jgi:hypothetical protein
MRPQNTPNFANLCQNKPILDHRQGDRQGVKIVMILCPSRRTFRNAIFKAAHVTPKYNISLAKQFHANIIKNN